MRHAWLVWVLALVAACGQPLALSPSKVADVKDIAACTAADGSWRCKLARPQTFGAGASSPIIPSSWTVSSWFVNKSTGSDQNPCTSSGSPCATKQEIWVHRWGMTGAGLGQCPRLQQTTTIEQDASDTDNTDPFYPCAVLEKGASLIIQGGPPTTTPATFTLVAAKNTGAGTNSLLVGSFSAGSPAAGTLVTNTTAAKSSRAWIYKTAGGANWNLSQPDAPLTIPNANLQPTEVNTWATNDTVTLSNPIAINIVGVNGMLADFNGGFTNAIYLYNMTIFDPAGCCNNNDVVVGGQTHLVEVASQRVINIDGTFSVTNIGAENFTNIDAMSCVSSSTGGNTQQPDIWSGIIGSSACGQVFFGPPGFGFDSIISGGAGGFILQNGGRFLSNIFLDENITVTGGLFETDGIVYGSGTNTINMTGSSHLAQLGGTFVQKFTAPGLVTGIKINGSTTADTHSGANPDVITTGVTCSPANMDAAGVPGCFLLGGASVTKN